MILNDADVVSTDFAICTKCKWNGEAIHCRALFGSRWCPRCNYACLIYRMHRVVDGICTHCNASGDYLQLLSCMTAEEAQKAYDEAEPILLESWQIDNIVKLVTSKT